MKRFISALLSLVMAIGLLGYLPVRVEAVSSSGMTLSQLKTKFPEGKYWNGGNVDGYTSYACTCHNKGICIPNIYPCTCNHYQGGTQCNGFAKKLAYDAYGSHLSTWKTSTSASYVDSLKPGDVVFYNLPHWFMVISVSADSVTVGECNWGSRCVIKWSRTIKKSSIKGYNDLEIYIAPYALPGGDYVPPTPPATIDSGWPSGSIYCMTLQTSGNVPACTQHNGNLGESYMTATDKQRILEVYKDGWCKVRIQPWNGNANDYRDRYTKLGYFTTGKPYRWITAKTKTRVYYRSDLSGSPGYVDVGDNCMVINESGNYYQIVCPWNNNSYWWICWVSKSAFECSHTWNSGTITTNATCTAAGVKTYTCTQCGTTKTESIAALGHNYSGSYYYSAHPHEEYQMCTRCNAEKKTGKTQKLISCSTCHPEQKVIIKPMGGQYNGSSVDVDKYVKFGSTFELDVPTRAGHTFIGWAPDVYGNANVSIFGEPLIDDPAFCNSGVNNLYVYDKAKSGSVKIERMGTLNVKITCTGGAEPGYGGYLTSMSNGNCPKGRPNSTFYHVIYAKVPSGHYLTAVSNLNAGAKFTWLTRQEGTGEWQWYVYRIDCSSSCNDGTFSHIYIAGGEHSKSNPLVWYVGYNEIFDAGKSLGKNLAKFDSDAIWLYAVWSRNAYNLNFDANGGTNAPTSYSIYYDYEGGITYDKPTKENYTFLGWSKIKGATNPDYKPGDRIKISSDTILYAVWKANTFTITYNANGGSGEPVSQTKESGKALTLSSTKPTRLGYTFLGWATSASASNAQYNAGSSFTTDANTTLYAVWRKDEVITSDVNFELSSANAVPGSTVELTLKVAGTTKVDLLTVYNIVYDKSVLEFQGVSEYGDLVKKCALPDNAFDDSNMSFTMGYADSTTASGTIAVLKFKVKDNAPEKDIIISYEAVATKDRLPVESSVKTSVVSISKWLSGDFNEDGKINMKDAVYFIGWVGAPFLPQFQINHSFNADFNKDGKINMKDAVYFIGWVGAPFLPQFKIDW